MSDKKIYKPRPVSGFPEWLPEERIVEQRWFDHIRRVFESYGFCSIETPSVEELDVITAKGEVDKEIYVLERLHKDEDDTSEARLALHFDQTVPMARYVAMNFNDLVFPFKRYQMQRVWRGERPQMGRMREFYQCDIDIVNVDNLPISFDADVAAVMYEVLDGLNQYADIGRVQLRISNRKLWIGLFELHDIFDSNTQNKILSVIDKREKLSEPEFKKLLHEALISLQHKEFEDADLLQTHIAVFLEVSDDIKKLTNLQQRLNKLKKIPEKIISEQINQLHKLHSTADNHTITTGIEELCTVLENLSHLPEGAAVADLSIVRGLDYYTGTVYETQLLDVPEFTGSVCSGGRYDDLAGSYINKHLPGVGISIGFSRLFDVMRQADRIRVGPKSPTDILVILPNEKQLTAAQETARTLRGRGFNVEVYHAPQKLQKQLSYAEKKGIPYVWFPPFDDGGQHEVKDMASKEQAPADLQTWTPKG